MLSFLKKKSQPEAEPKPAPRKPSNPITHNQTLFPLERPVAEGLLMRASRTPLSDLSGGDPGLMKDLARARNRLRR
jgi:hypothetical protein